MTQCFILNASLNTASKYGINHGNKINLLGWSRILPSVLIEAAAELWGAGVRVNSPNSAVTGYKKNEMETASFQRFSTQYEQHTFSPLVKSSSL